MDTRRFVSPKHRQRASKSDGKKPIVRNLNLDQPPLLVCLAAKQNIQSAANQLAFPSGRLFSSLFSSRSSFINIH